MNSEPSEHEPWFQDGLPFTCTRCGACCTGEEGFVWVDEVEIDRLAGRLGLNTTEFSGQFLRRVGHGTSLREREDGACVFWSADVGCTVYEDRPRQCRSWPFWNSNIRSEKTWNQTVQICPGAGNGRLFSVEEILAKSQLINL